MAEGEFIWKEGSYDKHKADFWAAELGISPLLAGVLLERGIADADSMRDFLYGSAKPFHDPFLLKGMGRSTARIEEAIKAGEKITVYGDYDADGITASSLLFLYLKGRGANVETYIPRRKDEGYGLHDESIRLIADSGTTLMVTVDCGISGINEVRNAPKGLDIIITDHHNVPEEIPPAYAVIDAKQKGCQYPFKDLSGVGIAFKICQALEQKEPGLAPQWQGLTELAALGTVADIVPLKGENRELVRRGLKAMATTELIGLRALIDESGLDAQKITSENIAFRLAPMLNAAGRMADANSAVELLTTDDEENAHKLAGEMSEKNAERKIISDKITEEAEDMLRRDGHVDTAIILASEKWHPGVIGIAASRLKDKYNLPIILISLSGETGKGSCRSIPALDLYQALSAQKNLLIQFGGHHQAAGLTIPSENVDAFRRKFKEYVASRLKPQDFVPVQVIDCVLHGNQEITLEDLEEFSLFEPCGCENEFPRFAFKRALLRFPRLIGDGKHLKFYLDKGNGSYDCVMWRSGSLMKYLFNDMLADVVFFPTRNEWQGRVCVQLTIERIKQDCTVGIFKDTCSKEAKLECLRNFALARDKITVCASGRHEEIDMDPALASRAEYCSYEDLKNENRELQSMAVFWSIPDMPLRLAVDLARQRGATHINILFNASDCDEAIKVLALTHPDRKDLETAFRKIRLSLQGGKNMAIKELVAAGEGVVGESAIKIFEELGFLSNVNGIISLNADARRNDLENSQLYRRLADARKLLEKAYEESMRLDNHALLRD